MASSRSFLPAAGRDWLLPVYDPLLRLLGEDRIKGALIEAADIRPGHRVLDLGCGTGTLALMIRSRCPGARVVGLDPDERALTLARRKAERAGTAIEWHRGFADDLPFEDRSFDRVVSSLVFHHLPADSVDATVREIARVLAPGGRALVLDFSSGGHGGLHGLLSRLVPHGHDHAHGDPHAAVDLPGALRAAGLQSAEARPAGRSILGALTLTSASAPA